MTWDEFKAEVDRQLKEQNADGSKLRVVYIDVGNPDFPKGYNRLVVGADKYEMWAETEGETARD